MWCSPPTDCGVYAGASAHEVALPTSAPCHPLRWPGLLLDDHRPLRAPGPEQRNVLRGRCSAVADAPSRNVIGRIVPFHLALPLPSLTQGAAGPFAKSSHRPDPSQRRRVGVDNSTPVVSAADRPSTNSTRPLPAWNDPEDVDGQARSPHLQRSQ
ncbi:hypothetical protein GCM10009646_60790 [Streptomyces aureus]